MDRKDIAPSLKGQQAGTGLVPAAKNIQWMFFARKVCEFCTGRPYSPFTHIHQGNKEIIGFNFSLELFAGGGVLLLIR